LLPYVNPGWSVRQSGWNRCPAAEEDLDVTAVSVCGSGSELGDGPHRQERLPIAVPLLDLTPPP
jgi:hypothetical protein